MVGFLMKTGQQITLRYLCGLAGMGFSWFFVVFIPSVAAADPVRSGERIYREQCASCHGTRGEGTDDHYPRALVGERSVAGLARLIAKTMPEDAPGDCVGEDAERVAAYIYESFYSKAAQARNKFRPSANRALAIDRAAVQERDRRSVRQFPGPRWMGRTSAA